MRKLILLIFHILIVGCTIAPKCPDGTRIILKSEFEKIITPDSLQWSVVSFVDLENYCYRRNLNYVGSFDHFHLIMWYQKVLPEPGAEFHFAVPDIEFAPEYYFKYMDRQNIPVGYLIQNVFDE